jgi:predicted Zn-dependent protease
MFTTTGVIVRLFHDKQAKIAVNWERAGNANLQAGHSQVAIEDFHNALLYSPNNSKLQLELAQALTAQGQLPEAESYLFSLRASDPDNALIDLQLARISVKEGDVNAAVNFYHDAAFGEWPSDAHASQVAAREELINFLMKNGRQDQARAEALSMAADNPADPRVLNEAAAYLIESGDTSNALDQYQHVLRLEPNNVTALIGAGNTALALYQFSEADRYFSRAIQRGAKTPDIESDRDLAAAAAELDPFNPRLNSRERQQRILEIFAAAQQRAQACMPAVLANGPTVPDNAKALAAARAALPAKLTLSMFNTHPEYADEALNWAFDLEKAVPSQCAGTLADRAIEVLAGENKES